MSKLDFKLIFYIVFCFSLSILSCGEDDEERRKEEWVQNEVKEKIREFISNQKSECYESILLDAEAEVDSILSQKDLFGNIIDKELPTKPERPEFIPLDSTALEEHKIEKVINK